MSKSKIALFTGLIITVFLLTFFSNALAATMKFRTVMFHKNVQIIKVEDIEGHIMAVAELTGLASLDTGEVGVVTVSAFADYIKGTGIAQGYIRLTFEDGSTIDYKYQHTTEAQPDGKISLFKSRSVEITQGSGKYAGIQGEGSFTGKRIAPLGGGAQLFLDTILTYNLP
jgi:hypothetical protein